ncbi:hypothetical protein DSM104443_01551 [Usitatibacter rugosus]|uniref:DUF2726 domain-containing protein n=1 Tax=Usitatibacter rugosus TaxID=2732067 RepID=A0A6M4GYA4_9PROT|nr:DUF2726 domain-containing protein [Usitatibacter rugosus]QJR10487.1 hypothetical protein DSM104443_01551 [Usitatibacter rugosus]
MLWMILVVVLVIVVVLAAWLNTKSPVSGAPDAYRGIKPLSEPEQTLYWRLREAMPECVVLSQVGFSRFLEPQAANPGARRALFNRIGQKSADFLVCLPDFTIVAVIELDDGTHRVDKDAKRDSILRSARVPLVRVHVREIPTVEWLRSIFTR